MKLRSVTFIVSLIIILSAASCRRNQFAVDISDIRADIVIERLERDLFEPDPITLPSSVDDLRRKYGTFLQLFSYVINAGSVYDTAFADALVNFCTDKLNNEVFESVMILYPDVKGIEDELGMAFRHYLYYFPDSHIPAICTCITGFNNSIILGDSVIGISLDRYLGRESEYYSRLGIYSYIAARMNPGNIVTDCMYATGTSDWEYRSAGYSKDDVMTQMIHEGKLKYFQRCMMPQVNDTVLFGFSADQMKFCRNNEMQMWHYMVEHDLLFSSDQFTIRKLTGEAPFTTFFTNESPGRAAIWIGYRIVESYMRNKGSISLKELMEDTDVQGILSAARYDPE